MDPKIDTEWLSLSLSFFFFLLFRAAVAAYGSSWARGWIGAVAEAYTIATAMSAIYAAACSNTRFFTHWARPGAFSWILVGFVTCWATVVTPTWFFIFSLKRERMLYQPRSICCVLKANKLYVVDICCFLLSSTQFSSGNCHSFDNHTLIFPWASISS